MAEYGSHHAHQPKQDSWQIINFKCEKAVLKLCMAVYKIKHLRLILWKYFMSATAMFKGYLCHCYLNVNLSIKVHKWRIMQKL